ncbi:MAG: DUF1800 domain-containing protein, partial [Pseudomonadota bacterium]|nr:DUF1800 domain-containing protein [Pseudomonadota bacterium]
MPGLAALSKVIVLPRPISKPPVVSVPKSVPLTPYGAARLLGQASMGASAADIASVQSMGITGWVDHQIAMPREISLWDWLTLKGYKNGPRSNDNGLMDMAVWRQAIVSNDQLRQRVGHALLDIFVVSAEGIAGYAHGFGMAAYIDLLMDGAFGSFRTLLGNVSSNACMASYLTFINSYKADPVLGTHPDENFAREVMQLFTIGLYQLNPDGTRKLAAGQPIETYTLDDISGLARVFTGFNWPAGDLTTPDPYRLPVSLDPSQHEMGPKSFLGTTIPAGTDGFTSRDKALDTLFMHANVGPFIGKQLIQRLVTSNPSPAYVGRVAAAFANDGKGVRGNLGAVVRQILLDPEARAGDAAAGTGNAADPVWGRLRTPAQRITNWARAFNATSPSDQWAIGDLSTPWKLLGESPGHASSVFNFFRPGYAPPGSVFPTRGLVAPELQATTEPTLLSYVNYVQSLVAGNVWALDVKADYSSLSLLKGNVVALLNELNALLAAGQL